jgi:5,10-methylenetetrahydromethanopterin reductase
MEWFSEMDFGIALATSADSWKLVKRAEALGFTHAWFYDTQLLSADCFVAMAAAAMQTSRIRLGTGVLIPSNRIAPVAANGLASLNRLAPGRIDFGVGTGFTARRTMGLGAIRLGELAEYLRVVHAMLAEETVEWESGIGRRKVRFLTPELGLIDTRHPIRTHLSAFGPRGRRLAAELGAGWMTFGAQPAMAAAGLDDMRSAWREAGRTPDPLYSTVFTLGCILEPGEPIDGPRVLAQAGPQAAVVFHDLVERSSTGLLDPASLPPSVAGPLEAYRKVYAEYEPADARYLALHRGHLMFLRPEEERILSPDLIRDLTFTATADELRDAGFSQFSIQVVPGHEDALEGWAELFESV